MAVDMHKSVKSAMMLHLVAKNFKSLTASRAFQAGNPTEYGIQEIRDANRNLASTEPRDIVLKRWSVVVERNLDQRTGFQKILLVHRLYTSAKADLIAGLKQPFNGPIDELLILDTEHSKAKLCCKRGESERAKQFAADFAREALIKSAAPNISVQVASVAPTSSTKPAASPSNAGDCSDPPQQITSEASGSSNVKPAVSKSRDQRIRKRKRGSEQESGGDAKTLGSAGITSSSVPLAWNGIPDVVQVKEPESYTETGPEEPLPKKQRNTWYDFPSASQEEEYPLDRHSKSPTHCYI